MSSTNKIAESDGWVDVAEDDGWKDAPEPGMVAGFINDVGGGAIEGAKYVGGLGMGALEYLDDKSDKYVRAPLRAGIAQAQQNIEEDPSAAVKAFISQIGKEDRKEVPTGKELVHRAGVPHTAISDVAPALYDRTDILGEYAPRKGGALDFTASGVAGGVLDTSIDPLNYIPLERIANTANRVAGPAVKAGMKAAGEGAEWGAKKVMNSMLDVPERAATQYMADPKFVNEALPRPKLGQKLADTLGDVQDESGKLYEAAQSTLSTEREALPHLEINKALDALDAVPDKDTQALAQKLRNEYRQRSGSIDGFKDANYLTEQEMDSVRKTLQDAAGDYSRPLTEAERVPAKRGAGQISGGLKENNPAYNATMAEQSSTINAKKGLAEKFGIKPDHSGANPSGFKASDQTMKVMGDLFNENKVNRAEVIKQLGDLGYGDLASEVERTFTKEVLSGPGRPNGSRKAVQWGNLGKASGIPGGQAVMSTLGVAADKYGPQMAKNLMDVATTSKKLVGTGAERFIPLLKKAEQNGPAAVATMHYLLQQSEPEFSSAITEPEY